MIVSVANLVSCALLGFGPVFGNALFAALPICWFPFLQIALPFARNSALVSAVVDVVLLLLLLPHPAATRPTVRIARRASPPVGLRRIETSSSRWDQRGTVEAASKDALIPK